MLVSLLYVCLSVCVSHHEIWADCYKTVYGHNNTDIVKKYHRLNRSNVKVIIVDNSGTS